MTRTLQAVLATVGLAFGVATASAATPTIELKDGSRIQGDIQSIDHGVYTVVSRSMGTLHIQQSDVARILYGGGHRDDDSGSAAPAADSAYAAQAKQLESRVMQDPEMMKSILDLQSDPQIQALLNDPAVIQAIQNGDYTSLMGNPKIQALESNSKLAQLLKQLQ